jgi:Uma2 family endonuclease
MKEPPVATITMPETSDQLSSSLSDDVLFEVVDGQFVETSPMGAYPAKLATTLGLYLGTFLLSRPTGQVVIEALFRIDPKNQRRPDVAFVSHARWPKGRRAPDSDPWDVVPDLTIEVVSKSDLAWEVLAKVRHYFEGGVRSVWLVFPKEEVVHVFESFTQIRVLTRDDVLDGGEVIPGFQLPLSSLFEEETAEGDIATAAG